MLRYASFAASGDGEGQGSWEAMASVQDEQLEAARAELRSLLDWAERHAPGPRGPLDDGGAWDAHWHEQAEDGGWTTLTLSLVGPWEWGETLVAKFEPAGDS